VSTDSTKISESKIYSKAAYVFLLFITDYYKRINEYGLDADEMMVVQTVVAQYSYKINSTNPKSYEDLKKLSNKEIQNAFRGSKLSILSIAEILGQPKESVRRRVQKLIDYQLLAKDTNGGIILCENYSKVIESFTSGTNKTFTKMLHDLNDMGALKLFLQDRQG
jgi:hypothetical protein